MTAKKSSGTGAGALLGGGTALALVLVALGWWVARDDTTANDAEATAPVALTGAPSATAESITGGVEGGATTEATMDAKDSEKTPDDVPVFDVVRVEPDGSAVIAGTAKPGANVQVLLDGKDAGQADVDINGNFVALLSLEPSDSPQVMSLLVDGETSSASDQTVIVGPIVAPETVIAGADPLTDEVADETADGIPTKGAKAQGEDADVMASSPSDVAQSGDETAAKMQTADIQTDAAGTAVDTAMPDNNGSDIMADQITQPTQEKAASTPQVLLADSDGIKVLQDDGGAEGAGDAAQVSLDSIAYDALGAVILAGRGAAEATVQIYLDGAELAQTLTGVDGQWRLELPQVDAGVYDLRVEVLDQEGKLLSQVETPFKREEPAQLAALSNSSSEAQGSLDASAGQTAEEPAPVASDQAQGGSDGDAGQDTVVSSQAQAEDAANRQDPSADVAAETPGSTDQGQEVLAAAGNEAGTATTAQGEGVAPVAAGGGSGAEGLGQSSSERPAKGPMLVTVQPGATLWAIARDNLGEGTLYVQVFAANQSKIRNPDLIYPGQIFTVPTGN